MTTRRNLCVNLAGFVDTPKVSDTALRVDRYGRPYLPIGDGGVTTGFDLGDSVFGTEGDHAAPGACLSHPSAEASRGLASFACLGNRITVRGGAAEGAEGVVLGKRGENALVIACFPASVRRELAPGDAVTVHGYGQGASLPVAHFGSEVRMMNLDPRALPILPIDPSGSHIHAQVRAAIPSRLVGYGLGRPAQQWCLDIQVDGRSAGAVELDDLRLGDLVAVNDLDVRHNMGYRRGCTTIGIVVHGWSPQPGHGPGLMPLLCAESHVFQIEADPTHHRGITLPALLRRAQLTTLDAPA